jgi:hypothetical protein
MHSLFVTALAILLLFAHTRSKRTSEMSDDNAMDVDEQMQLRASDHEPAAVAAAAAALAPMMPGHAPVAEAAAGAAEPQQQNLPHNSAEAADVVRQRFDDFKASFTIATIAIMTARDLHRTGTGNILSPAEMEEHKTLIAAIEFYVTTYAENIRQHEFGFAAVLGGLVLDATAETIECFQQKLQLTTVLNAEHLHATATLGCVMAYLQQIHIAFQPAKLPACQQRLQHACDHLNVIRQREPPLVSRPGQFQSSAY